MVGLTPRMAELRDFIAGYQDSHAGVSPSYDEMMAAMGLRSKSPVHRLITSLEERGVVTRARHRKRTVSIKHETSMDVATEHIQWAIKNGIGIRTVLLSIFDRTPMHITLRSAIEQVAVAYERLQESA